MEVVVASGKGGTGKTFISSNLVFYLHKTRGSVVAVDADAEAPDLLIALGGSARRVEEKRVSESRKAVIDYNKCISCLKCMDVCMFNAIEDRRGRPVVIREYCEGCGACSLVCPASAIGFASVETGVVRVDYSPQGIPVVTADLVVGGRNTGELVYRAREKASAIAREAGAGVIVVDAAAGIGCPVVSSLAGADILVAVVEPLPPSIQGAARLLELARRFNIRSFLVINKHDLNPELSRRAADELDAELLGVIPYSSAVAESYSVMKPILELSPDHPVSRALTRVYEALAGVAGF